MLELPSDLQCERGGQRLLSALQASREGSGSGVDALVYAAGPPRDLSEHLQLVGLRQLPAVDLAEQGIRLGPSPARGGGSGLCQPFRDFGHALGSYS